MTSIHICVVAEFEDFAALSETKLAPAAMRESDDWIWNITGSFKLCVNFFCAGKHVYHGLDLLLIPACLGGFEAFTEI